MSTVRPQRSQARRGSNVRELRPSRPPAEVPSTLDRPDLTYVAALVGLISVGMIMVYSTTAIEGISSLVRMGIWLGIGVPGMLVASRLPMGFWRAAAPGLLIVCFLVLASLLLKERNPLAVEVNGAYRWLRIPGVGQIQPSEISKFAFILFAAQYLDQRAQKMNGRRWLTFLGVLGAFAGVIYKEPDLGTALVLTGTAFCMLLAAGIRWGTLIKGVVVLAALVFALAWTTDHQRDRLLSWWNPWAEEHRQEGGYQTVRSLSAMSQGGLTGVGLGRSTYKLDNRLPEAETDFIFAIVAEELGMVRALTVLGLFALLAWRGFSIAARAPDRYSALVATGITSWVAVQSCLNVAVVTGTVPNTGVPLPFISSGGSSLTALMIASGVVVGISRRRPVKEEAVR
ncbi:MAG TPA: putative peptidoglycan glycosyltransferase FtsW [Symbiobacteriaceae bacterium]|nr:putative peptidoglycan glycosyltransferase FtsW [Symbiobacteriaceae bacterium]